MLSTWRDPFRSVVDDWVSDPFATDFLPLSTVANLGRNTGHQRSTAGRLMTLDAFEDQNNFSVVCEVLYLESL
jgi:hypothetical protein